jgi:hypothetical protein
MLTELNKIDFLDRLENEGLIEILLDPELDKIEDETFQQFRFGILQMTEHMTDYVKNGHVPEFFK